MFIVNWDILEFCSQWNRMMGLNCFRGLLCAGCNSREPLFTGGKKFYIPHTVRISTEVNEIFAWVRINTCNQSRWFSEKQARCWSACWLCSCIFCHLDLESYPILIAFCYLHPLTVGHFTAATHYHLSYKECLCEKKELKFFNWFFRQILVHLKSDMLTYPHFISYCFLLRTWWLYEIHNALGKFVHARDPSFWTMRMSGRFFPSDT